MINLETAKALGLTVSPPGANITGFSNFETTMAAKWLEEVLIEMAPNVRRILFLFNPTTRPNLAYLRTAELAAPAMTLQLVPAQLSEPADIESAITAFAQTPNGGLVVSPDVFMQVHRALIVSFAAKFRLPAVYGFRYYVTDGGLMSYGHNTLDPYRQMPAYVDRILRGVKPGELPVQAPTKFELVINLKTANALGLTVPPTLLNRADEVFE